jgi:UDP-2-acetamido-2-deoxy-ribo-hexuluronate aminotransferase
MKIEMVDLKNQYIRIQKEIDREVLNVIREANYINGPQVFSFKKNLERYLAVGNVIPCANGTDALQIAIMALDLKRGDEVIVPAFTYIATAEVVALLGLKPVWVDVNPETFNIDPLCFEAAITPKTRLVVPVHLYGQCAEMESIMRIAKKHGIYVIEDTAQAIGAEYTYSNGENFKAGTIGNIGCTSFFPSKNLGCFGDGGAIISNDQSLAKKIQIIANHGQEVKYIHSLVGVNSRLDTLQSAILDVKLKYLDQYNQARLSAASIYDSMLCEIEQIQIPVRFQKSTHVFHQYTIKVKDGSRDNLKSYLADNNITTMIYYPIPIHLQEAYLSNNYKFGSFPVSEELSNSVLSLPMHTELNLNTLEFICHKILKFYKR